MKLKIASLLLTLLMVMLPLAAVVAANPAFRVQHSTLTAPQFQIDPERGFANPAKITTSDGKVWYVAFESFGEPVNPYQVLFNVTVRIYQKTGNTYSLTYNYSTVYAYSLPHGIYTPAPYGSLSTTYTRTLQDKVDALSLVDFGYLYRDWYDNNFPHVAHYVGAFSVTYSSGAWNVTVNANNAFLSAGCPNQGMEFEARDIFLITTEGAVVLRFADLPGQNVPLKIYGIDAAYPNYYDSAFVIMGFSGSITVNPLLWRNSANDIGNHIESVWAYPYQNRIWGIVRPTSPSENRIGFSIRSTDVVLTYFNTTLPTLSVASEYVTRTFGSVTLTYVYHAGGITSAYTTTIGGTQLYGFYSIDTYYNGSITELRDWTYYFDASTYRLSLDYAYTNRLAVVGNELGVAGPIILYPVDNYVWHMYDPYNNKVVKYVYNMESGSLSSTVTSIPYPSGYLAVYPKYWVDAGADYEDVYDEAVASPGGSGPPPPPGGGGGGGGIIIPYETFGPALVALLFLFVPALVLSKYIGYMGFIAGLAIGYVVALMANVIPSWSVAIIALVMALVLLWRKGGASTE